MNKILTTSISDPTIGQPLTGKSLEFLQNATKESISSVIESTIGSTYSAATYYVLSGLNPYGTNQFYAGYVYYNGEVYYGAGKSTTTAFVNIPVLTLTVTNDATADPLTFTDNVSRNVHNVRRMVMSDAVSGTGTVDLKDCSYINVGWVTIGAGGFCSPFLAVPAFQNSWVNYDSALIDISASFKKEGKNIHFRATIDGGASGSVLVTMPVGYRPIYDVKKVFHDGTFSWFFTFLTTGNVSCTFSGGVGFYIDTIFAID